MAETHDVTDSQIDGLVEGVKRFEAEEDEARSRLSALRNGADELEAVIAGQLRMADELPNDAGMQENADLAKKLESLVSEKLDEAQEALNSACTRREIAEVELKRAMSLKR